MVGVTAPRVAHDEVEPAGFPLDPLEQRLHLRVVRVIGARGNAATAPRGHLLGDFVDGRAPGQVDGGTGLAEDESHASADAAGRARDERHGPVEPRRRPGHETRGFGAASNAACSSSGIPYVCFASGKEPLRTSSA